MLGVELCHLYHMEGGDVCVTPFCVRPEYLRLRKLQKSCLSVIVLYNFINFNVYIACYNYWFIHE